MNPAQSGGGGSSLRENSVLYLSGHGFSPCPGVSTFSNGRHKDIGVFKGFTLTNAEVNTLRPLLSSIRVVNGAYGPPKRMKMIGGPLKPFLA
jgi:hypothetical protein